jgi:hypothetical protein
MTTNSQVEKLKKLRELEEPEELEKLEELIKKRPLDNKTIKELQKDLNIDKFITYAKTLKSTFKEVGYCPIAETVAKNMFENCLNDEANMNEENKNIFVNWFKQIIPSLHLGGSPESSFLCGTIRFLLLIVCIILGEPPNTYVSSGAGTGAKNTKTTSKRIKVDGRERVVYEGPRGGKYIKQNGTFISLKQLKL